MNSSVIFAPAKLNLFLAVTGRRADGFHDLVSLVAPVTWGDQLRIEATTGDFSLTCDDPSVPVDETNLVLKAANAFRAATRWTGGAKFSLEKKIPMGAGLGGGSSDAAAALRGLNDLAGGILTSPELEKLASEVGSDCALFLRQSPVVMRGRGERLENLPVNAAARLRGQPVLIFKPAFGISTPWAYARLAADPVQNYFPAAAAEEKLARWLNDGRESLEDLCCNSFERIAFQKHIALPTLLGALRERFDLKVAMSGSGSACFAFLAPKTPVADVVAAIREAWGSTAFVAETRLL